MRSLLRVLPLAALFMATSLHAAPSPPSAEERAAFVAEVSREHGIDAAAVEAMLGAAKYQQSIIDAITRPAEAKPWKDYRPIFLTADRIAKGRAFLETHREALAKVEALAVTIRFSARLRSLS